MSVIATVPLCLIIICVSCFLLSANNEEMNCAFPDRHRVLWHLIRVRNACKALSFCDAWEYTRKWAYSETTFAASMFPVNVVRL